MTARTHTPDDARRAAGRAHAVVAEAAAADVPTADAAAHMAVKQAHAYAVLADAAGDDDARTRYAGLAVEQAQYAMRRVGRA